MDIDQIEAIRAIVRGEVEDALKRRDEETAAEMARICAGRTPGDFLRVAEPAREPRTLRDDLTLALAPIVAGQAYRSDGFVFSDSVAMSIRHLVDAILAGHNK